MHQRTRAAGGTLLLAIFAAAVAGFHPYSEDGGVYLAGVKKLLHPALYPTWAVFVTEHLRFSLFAPTVAALAHFPGLTLDWLLLLLYLLGAWATLFAGWILIAKCTVDERARWGAITLLACWLTLPIAGTSLILMDPYVTARTFSTPLVLAAIAWALSRQWLYCALALTAAAAMHPLMAGYGLAAILVLTIRPAWLPPAAALVTATILQLLAPPENLAYRQVVATRYYWFLSQWQWYEILGLLGPIAILLWLSRRQPFTQLARTAILLGTVATAIAILFARLSTTTHLVARMQPLRCFQIVYLVMALLLGAWLGERILQAKSWRWIVFLASMGAIMFSVQRNIYPHSAHIEWPGTPPRNAWQQAFLWARDNTPPDALFALDAHYITQGPGEDAQCFRAIAERSALPDYSKDGGEASITPALTDDWLRGQSAQTNLETMPNTQRHTQLTPLHVTWIVLQTNSQTAWSCPYVNATVKLCRVE